MIPVSVANLFLSNHGFVVFLRAQADARVLPIFIGVAEAQAIALQLNNVSLPRPLTHDLLKRFLELLECRVEHVEITELRDGTFYAVIVVNIEGQLHRVDARPSDAIALALRCHVPLGVAERVMAEAGTVVQPGTEEQTAQDTSATRAGDSLDELRRQLADAIREERYEDAARWRDEIRRLTHFT